MTESLCYVASFCDGMMELVRLDIICQCLEFSSEGCSGSGFPSPPHSDYVGASFSGVTALVLRVGVSIV